MTADKVYNLYERREEEVGNEIRRYWSKTWSILASSAREALDIFINRHVPPAHPTIVSSRRRKDAIYEEIDFNNGMGIRQYKVAPLEEGTWVRMAVDRNGKHVRFDD